MKPDQPSHSDIQVSLIIATYNSGTGIERLVDSLDRQTLAPEHFEVIFVDDGSTDNTYNRLIEIAAARPNVRFDRIENSGWPSKPRNVGIKMARGEYLVFADHDDTLYPDALRSAVVYARAHDADILIPKEMKSNDSWWYYHAMVDGNIPDVIRDGGFERMLPMVPHKLYRRQLFLDHDITFPERRRALWEDQYINVAAYRHARRVSLLADTPFYLWHASDTNTSHTFDPANLDFWDRLEDIMAFMNETLDDPRMHEARVTAIGQQLQARVLDRFTRLLSRANDSTKEMAASRAASLLKRFGTREVVASLPRRQRALAYLLRRRKLDLMVELHRFDSSQNLDVKLSDLSWEEGSFSGTVSYTWNSVDEENPAYVVDRGRLRWNLPRELKRALPRRLRDLEPDLGEVEIGLSLRNRRTSVAWFPALSDHETRVLDGPTRIVTTAHFTIDIDHLAGGGPLDPSVWDMRARSLWLGMIRATHPITPATSYPSMIESTAAVAYRNKSGGLSLDTDQQLRSLAIDSLPGAPVQLDPRGFTIELKRATGYGVGQASAKLYAVPADHGFEAGSEELQVTARSGALDWVISNVDGKISLTGSVNLAPGTYDIHAFREGAFRKTARSLQVDGSESAQLT